MFAVWPAVYDSFNVYEKPRYYTSNQQIITIFKKIFEADMLVIIAKHVANESVNKQFETFRSW